MTDDIDRMTDEELVRACAEEVMGWKSRGGCLHSVNDSADAFGTGRIWEPLESWDDCFMVVNAMRALTPLRIFTLSLGVGFRVSFDGAKAEVAMPNDQIGQRRAVLRAALKAVRSKP